MRRPYISLLPLALVAATLLSSTAYAQRATPPEPAAAPPSVNALPAPAPEAVALAVPAPPGAKLRFEMDARSEDLLGLVKSFLKDVGEANSANRLKANAAFPAAPVPPINPIEEALESGNLADILKDVNHLHFAIWELPPSFSGSSPNVPTTPPTKAGAASPSLDTNSFYEHAFQAEGAHRILFTDADEYKLVMVGFPEHRGFAFAASGLPSTRGGYIAVARADGYPNMEALSAFITHITSAVLKTKAGKQMVDATLNGGKGAGADDKAADDKAAGDKK